MLQAVSSIGSRASSYAGRIGKERLRCLTLPPPVVSDPATRVGDFDIGFGLQGLGRPESRFRV